MADDLDELDAQLAAAGMDADDDSSDPMDDLSSVDLDDLDDLDLDLDLDLDELLAGELDAGADDEDDEDDAADPQGGEQQASDSEDTADRETPLEELDEDAPEEPAVLASTILDEELDDEASARDRDDVPDEDELREGEFVCRSCFMAKRDTAMADEERMFCRDCV